MNSNVTGEGEEDEVVPKNPLQFSAINSIDMKTKLVQHVESD